MIFQVHTLLKGVENIAGSSDMPMLVCGDFNSVPGSAPHALLTIGKVDPLHPDLVVDPLGILCPTTKLTHTLPLDSRNNEKWLCLSPMNKKKRYVKRFDICLEYRTRESLERMFIVLLTRFCASRTLRLNVNSDDDDSMASKRKEATSHEYESSRRKKKMKKQGGTPRPACSWVHFCRKFIKEYSASHPESSGLKVKRKVMPPRKLHRNQALQVYLDPSIKELAEQIAKDPSFNQMAEQLQYTFHGANEGIPQFDTQQFYSTMEQVMQNPQFMNMAERLGSAVMQDPSMSQMLESLSNPAQKDQLEERVARIKEDPSFKPILEGIEFGGPTAMMK
ncbi:putative Endonuclease/exonuclease/phosphatase superfamily [Helianthus anomalus]